MDHERGEQAMGLSFRKPIITRGGNKIRLYHIYQHEIHGAYEADEDRWIIARWEMNGYFYPLNDKGKQPITSLDLINDDWEMPEDNPRLAS